MPRNNRVIHVITIASLLLLSFYILGCTNNTANYTVAKENKVLLAVETKQPKRILENEDQLIIQALFLEENNAYKQSSEVYSELYEKTKKEEYLLREAVTAHNAGIVSKHIKALEDYVITYPKQYRVQRLLLSFYLKQKNLHKAKKIGYQLTQNSKEAVDYELAANPCIFLGEYDESIEYLMEAYAKTLNEDILLKIITIQINYLNNVQEAIKNLELHRTKQGCSEKICLQLVNIYTQQSNIQAIIPIYKELYKTTKQGIYAEKIIEIYLLNQQLDLAITYLETEHQNDTLLYALYMEKKAYTKANILTQELLKATMNPKWYAESAISRFESLTNKNDKIELQKVIHDFEKYLEAGKKNPIYLNYYGYTLIDKDLNITKGIKAVEAALELEPENTYFLDSLAWGHYKLNNCEKAYPTMKKVVEVEGLNEEEIILHWNAINHKCREK